MIDPEIADYYERAPEETRLTQGPFKLEAARTRELIERHAPPPPADEELRDDVESAGISVEGLYGIEGPGWMFRDFEERWADPERRTLLLRAARLLESEPAMIGCSAHLLAVGRKS